MWKYFCHKYLKNRSQLAYNRHPPYPQVLPNRHLQEEYWNTTDEHGEEVRDQEGSLNRKLLKTLANVYYDSNAWKVTKAHNNMNY